MAPLDLVSALAADELRRRQDRLLERRHKLARFRDPERSLDTFDFDFNKKMNRALVYELATARFIAQREDVLFLAPPGTGKSHLAQAIGRAAILQGYRVVYREAHTLLEELAEATLAGTRKNYLAELATVPLLIIDDLGMRKLAHTAAEDLLEMTSACSRWSQPPRPRSATKTEHRWSLCHRLPIQPWDTTASTSAPPARDASAESSPASRALRCGAASVDQPGAPGPRAAAADHRLTAGGDRAAAPSAPGSPRAGSR
jgi:hypothetical protein